MAEVLGSSAGFDPGRRTALALGAALVFAGCSTRAMAGRDAVELQVVDRDTGKVLEVWRHAGRSFVAGSPGARYTLRVRNRTGARLLAVISVDGVNIVTGQTAAWSQPGYVLDPWAWYDLNGWRKSATHVAAFEFAPLAESYAARTGRSGNVGVIGLAVFDEGERMPTAPSAVGRHSNQDAGSGPMADEAETAQAARSQRRDKLGTAHGRREWSVASSTSFVRASTYPLSVLAIEYDSYANLVAMGVVPPPSTHHGPLPFPAQPRHSYAFVPDPPP
jgi:hypothetical protein